MTREIDEAMASASAEGRMEEEVKGECELEREEGTRWDIEKKELIAEECENERDYENEQIYGGALGVLVFCRVVAVNFS